MKRTRKKEKKTQKRGWDRKREEDGQKNDQKCLKFRGDLAEGKRNVQHQKHRSALRALKNQIQFVVLSLCKITIHFPFLGFDVALNVFADDFSFSCASFGF